MSMTNYMTNKLLDYLFRAKSFTPPATYYVGLSTSLIDETGVISEPSGSGYTRQAIQRADTAWSDPTGNYYIENNTVINFPESMAPWGTIKAIFLADADGNVLYFNNLDSFIPVGNSTKITIGYHELRIEGA